MTYMKYRYPIKDSWVTSCFMLVASLLVTEFNPSVPKRSPKLHGWMDTCKNYIENNLVIGLC